jgi:ribosomal protein S18 acetylase RimI-like enzyme
VFAATEEDAEQAWHDLGELVGDGTASILRVGASAPPDGWTRLGSGHAHQMVLRELRAASAPDGVRVLGPLDAGEMLALVELTRPGPFALRTVELGGYVGVYEDGDLVAMAGERLAPPGHREISAVCTHPDHRGRGLGAGLTTVVARNVLARGEVPFLHCAVDNPARRVYEALGFEVRTEATWQVLARR